VRGAAERAAGHAVPGERSGMSVGVCDQRSAGLRVSKCWWVSKCFGKAVQWPVLWKCDELCGRVDVLSSIGEHRLLRCSSVD
jgi:hypothetical protein